MKVNLTDGFIHSLASKNKKKPVSGFTLIELLVVVGILAILAGVIWSQLGSSIYKGKDAAIKADLQGIQSQAAIEFLNLGRRFSTTGSAIISGDCATLTTANTIFASTKIQQALLDIKKQNDGVPINCNVAANGLAYAIAVTLRTTGKYWCVDSAGASRGTQGGGASAYIGQYAGSSAYAINSGGPQYSCS